MTPTHGIASTYRSQKYKCRCPECTRANADLQAAENAARHARLARGEVVLAHGIIGTYSNWGCRCVDCKAANAEQSRRKRRRQAERVAS